MIKKVIAILTCGLILSSVITYGLNRSFTVSGKVKHKFGTSVNEIQQTTPSGIQLVNITSEEADKIVMDIYKDGKIFENELEREDGKMQYEIKLEAGNVKHIIIIDASSGSVIKDKFTSPDITPISPNTVDTVTSATQAPNMENVKGRGRKNKENKNNKHKYKINANKKDENDDKQEIKDKNDDHEHDYDHENDHEHEHDNGDFDNED